MALGDIEVVGIMGWGYLDGSGPKLDVYCGVGYNGNWAFQTGEYYILAYEIDVAFIVGVDGDGGVAEEGFGAVVATVR